MTARGVGFSGPLEHWRAYLPASYGGLEDPVRFFTEQVGAEIEGRYLEYAGPDVPRESAEGKQARLTQAMNRASEEVFAELVTPSPASQGEPYPEEVPGELACGRLCGPRELAVST